VSVRTKRERTFGPALSDKVREAHHLESSNSPGKIKMTLTIELTDRISVTMASMRAFGWELGNALAIAARWVKFPRVLFGTAFADGCEQHRIIPC
jgi:hypothetical protein